ncbi:MAG: MFS transporter [Thermaerobacter sp.]|nr:MFS transporter [Thermaerobacter sp.]
MLQGGETGLQAAVWMRRLVPGRGVGGWPLGLLNAIQIARSFGSGLLAVIFALYVAHWHLGPAGIGVLGGLSVVVGGFYTVLFTRGAGRLGAEPFLAASGLLMVAAGLVYANAHSLWQVWTASLCGFVPPAGGLFVNALEEGMIAQWPSAGRTRAFAFYGMLGTAAGAVGALSAGGPDLLGWSGFNGLRVLLWIYAGLGGVVLAAACLLYWGSSGRRAGIPASSPEPSGDAVAPFGLDPGSRRLVHRLARLFVADSLGSGMVTTTLLVYWLHARYHLGTPALGTIFFAVDVAAALSFPLAARLSRSIGLLNTAVFTHIPSSLLLMAVPFAGSSQMAAALLIARGLLVEMDVPTRQSYLAAVVNPAGRAEAAGVTSLGKQAGRTAGPVLGGLLLKTAGASLPFLIGGTMKILYDVSLWRSFRRIPEQTESNLPYPP